MLIFYEPIIDTTDVLRFYLFHVVNEYHLCSSVQKNTNRLPLPMVEK